MAGEEKKKEAARTYSKKGKGQRAVSGEGRGGVMGMFREGTGTTPRSGSSAESSPRNNSEGSTNGYGITAKHRVDSSSGGVSNRRGPGGEGGGETFESRYFQGGKAVEGQTEAEEDRHPPMVDDDMGGDGDDGDGGGVDGAWGSRTKDGSNYREKARPPARITGSAKRVPVHDLEERGDEQGGEDRTEEEVTREGRGGNDGGGKKRGAGTDSGSDDDDVVVVMEGGGGSSSSSSSSISSSSSSSGAGGLGGQAIGAWTKSQTNGDDAPVPCILFMDSLGCHSESAVTLNLRWYLMNEYRRIEDKKRKTEENRVKEEAEEGKAGGGAGGKGGALKTKKKTNSKKQKTTAAEEGKEHCEGHKGDQEMLRESGNGEGENDDDSVEEGEGGDIVSGGRGGTAASIITCADEGGEEETGRGGEDGGGGGAADELPLGDVELQTAFTDGKVGRKGKYSALLSTKVRVPSQQDGFNCGIFILIYAERFVAEIIESGHPLSNFKVSPKSTNSRRERDKGAVCCECCKCCARARVCVCSCAEMVCDAPRHSHRLPTPSSCICLTST